MAGDERAGDGRAGDGRRAGRDFTFRPLRPEDPERIAGFRLVARLGSGGMGTVYLAHMPDGEPTALKVIRPELAEAPDFQRQFAREIQAARRVRGQFTVPVLESDIEGPVPWLATSYVAGPSLGEAVGAHGPLPELTVVRLMAGVAEALQAIHAAGVVHRDLKPSNVLLAVDGPRVIDFGVARAADATTVVTEGARRVGTPGFMAPEQVRTDVPEYLVTPRADMFSLGLLTCFAASGSGAFGRGEPDVLLYRIVHDEPDLSGCPEGLRALIGACLAKDPAARPGPEQVLAACAALAGGAAATRPAMGWLPAAVAEETALRAAPVPPAADPPTPPGGGFGPVITPAGHQQQAPPPGPMPGPIPEPPPGPMPGPPPAPMPGPYPTAAVPPVAGGSTPSPAWLDQQLATEPRTLPQAAGPAGRRRGRVAAAATLAVVLVLAIVAGGGYAFGLLGGSDGDDRPQASDPAGDQPQGPDGSDAGEGAQSPGRISPEEDLEAEADESLSPAEPEDDKQDEDQEPDQDQGQADEDSPGNDQDRDTGASPKPSSTPSPDRSSSPPPATEDPEPAPSTSNPTVRPPPPGQPGKDNCTYTSDRSGIWRQGSSGTHVRQIQCLLKYNYKQKLDVDGQFGPLTEAAVRRVQQCSGIEVDGEVGPVTWTYLDNPKRSCV
jgi:hypothetical protein